MPDSAQIEDPLWQLTMARENQQQLADFIKENAAVMDPLNNNTITFKDGDTLDDDLIDLAAKGYASQAILLQIAREVKGIREGMKPVIAGGDPV